MKHSAFAILTSVVLLSALPLGCSDNTPLDPTTSYLRSDGPDGMPLPVTRPFLGHWETTFANFDPVGGTIEITGNGPATHLGLSTFFTVQPLFPGVPFDAVLTAANGDELHYVAIGDPGEVPPPDPFSFSGTLVFVPGGTGRFANATGSATFEGTASLVTMTGEVTYTGSITF